MQPKEFYFDKTIIIDDSEVDRYIARFFIETCNFSKQIVEFEMAHNAIQYLENYSGSIHEKALILLDIHMPVMNGFEFLERMEEFLQNAKDNFSVVMLSSSFDIYDLRRAEQNPLIKKFVVKPLNESSLEEIKKCLALREEKEIVQSKL